MIATPTPAGGAYNNTQSGGRFAERQNKVLKKIARDDSAAHF